MEIRLTKCALLCLFALPLAVQAGGDSGFYLGGGVGSSKIKGDGTDSNGTDFKFDDNDTGYKLIVGSNFGIIPLIDLGVEASYVDFGEINDSTAAGKADVEASGYDAFGVGALTFGPFGVFAKAGVINWDSKTKLGSASEKESGNDAAYGVGARFQLFSFSLRAEYEWFDVDGLNDLTMASVSALYTF
jgi:opacity protein-like surface antigen